MSAKRFDLCVRLFLGGATGLVYAQVWQHAFLNYDDNQYVTQNPQVLGGLTPAGLRWAFTGIHSANWHPLTTLSHMLDVQLFGVHAGSHLLVNVLLHAISAIVLYEIFRHATAQRGASAFVAALFALHPLHVESVAWVAERKDALSALLGLLSIAAYIAWVRRPSAGRYALALLLLALGLLAKPMLVTLPFIFLLFDWWPLRRLSPVRLKALAIEKLPFLLLAVAAAAVTFAVQRSAGAVVATGSLPVSIRLGNALLATATYLAKSVWPVDLAVFYPMQLPIPSWKVAAATAVLGAISALVWLRARRQPYLVTGWLWYLAMLVPVIGLVQVGDQAMADRYTYLPSIGLSVMLAFGASELAAGWRRGRLALSIAAAAVVLACAALTAQQLRHWRNSETLFNHALAVTEGNYVAHTNLAAVMLERGRAEDAVAHFEQAVSLRPDHAQAQINIRIARGFLLAQRGDGAGAAAQYAAALEADPSNAMAHFNWGVLLVQQGDLSAGAEHYGEALRLAPDYAKAHNNLGLVRARQGRWDEALTHYRRALELAPYLAEAYGNLGIALETTGDRAGALAAYRSLVRMQPHEPKARYNLAALLADLGQTEQAEQQYRAALRLVPGWAPAEEGLAKLRAQ